MRLRRAGSGQLLAAEDDSVSAAVEAPHALGEAPEPAEGRLLTAEELAERWQVPKAQVYRLTREGSLPSVAIGRYRRYSLPAVLAWEQGGGASANA